MATVKQAAKAVKELEKERVQLAGRIATLEAERETAPVSKLGAIASELGALGATVAVVDGRLPGARQALADAREAEKHAAVLALRPKEAKSFALVVDQTLRLRDALRDLDAVRSDLARAGAGVVGSTGIVGDGVRSQVVAWRVQQNMTGQYGGRVRLTFDD